MITGRDIVYISSIEWDFLWQGPQEIATRLAQAGNRVLYIENTGIRSPGLRDVDRVAQRLKRWTQSWRSLGVRQVAPNLNVCSPLVLPPFGSNLRRQLNRRYLLPLIERTVRSLGMRDPLLWTYLPTDTALELINSLRTPQSLVVYYYVDNFSLLTPYTQQLKQAEQSLMQLSDLIFTTCAGLAAHCEPWNSKVHIIPYGVNLDAFPVEEIISGGNGAANNSHGASQGAKQNDLIKSDKSPVIGYVGGLHRHVDFDLLTEMAHARPDWSWVYVGSVHTASGRKLAELPNVHFLGAQPHRKLASYIRGFDVCIVPYVNSPYTQTVVPTKINEYLAVGKPVISTALPAVSDFNERHKVLLTTDNQPEDFLRAIEQALQSPNNAAAIARRREVASLGDWQARVEVMSQLIHTELQSKQEKNNQGQQ